MGPDEKLAQRYRDRVLSRIDSALSTIDHPTQEQPVHEPETETTQSEQTETREAFTARMVGKTCALCQREQPFRAEDDVVELEQPDGAKTPAHSACFLQRENQDLRAELERAHVVFAAALARAGGTLELRAIDFRRAKASGFEFEHAELPESGHQFSLKRPPLVVLGRPS